jgi:hypothetical protein
MVNQNFKNLSIMTTVYIFTHVFMLVSALAIGWLAASSDNENIDVEIKSGSRNFRTNQTKVQPVKSGDFSFGKIFFIKEMLHKTSGCSKRGLPIGLMFLTLVLIALMILLSQY